MGSMSPTVRAELLDFQPVGIVAAVLLGDVVAVFAHLARQSDLWPYVGTGRHVSCPLPEIFKYFVVRVVAMAGLEPAT